MSRIGKQLITIPGGVEIKMSGREVSVKGPKGQLNWGLPESISVKLEDKQLQVSRPDDTKEKKALHGLARSVISNMVHGVVEGFKKELELSGVGYRAQVQGNKIAFAIGFSHPVEFELPSGIKAEVDKKQTQLVLTGIDKQLLGQTAANIRELRLPDAYKGKGIRYAGQRMKFKPGKTGK